MARSQKRCRSREDSDSDSIPPVRGRSFQSAAFLIRPEIAGSQMAADSKNALRPEIDRIINSGREQPVSAVSIKRIFVVAALTGILLWLSFTPLEFAAAAWVALVPLSLLLRVYLLPKFTYRMLMLVGFLWALATLQWMRLGHWSMYGALVALSFYLSMYFPAFVAISRTAVRGGFPVWLTVPIVWTAIEYLRAYLLTGFSWYYLGHSQYQWTSLVQISDVTGAYGVSFIVALVSGGIVECIPARLFVRWGLAEAESDVRTLPVVKQRMPVFASLGLVVAACLYGVVRMQPTTVQGGPVVAAVQGNFTPELKHDPGKWQRMLMSHDLLTRNAASLQPDLIVWPETMFPWPDQELSDGVTDDDLIGMLPLEDRSLNKNLADRILHHWHSGETREALVGRSQESGSALLVGLITEVAEKGKISRYNSAAFTDPVRGYQGRYDKAHRVIFGEYVPLKSALPWLSKMTPYGAGSGIDAGTQPSVFEYNGTRFAPIICFEDTVPQLVRRTALAKDADGKSADVLINMTNDGWFRGSSELDQHLVAATFRCIETRRPMVRAVNAGISAFIDSSGRIRQPEHFWLMKEDTAGVVGDFTELDSMIDPETGKHYRQCSAVMCGQVPLDGRGTVYLAFGDWFAMLCSLVTVGGVVMGRMRSTDAAAEVSAAVGGDVLQTRAAA